jgi:hypothetical protein
LATATSVALTVPARVTSNDLEEAPHTARLLENTTVVVVGVGFGVVGGSSSHPARVSDEASTRAARVVLRVLRTKGVFAFMGLSGLTLAAIRDA